MTNVVPISGTPILSAAEPTQHENAAFVALSEALSSRYVRREHRFYHVDRPGEPLSRRDVEQVFLYQAKTITPDSPIAPDLMKRVFSHCIDLKHTDPTTTIPVWGGELVCLPGNRHRVVPLKSGSVLLNTWVEPAYRRGERPTPYYGVFAAFFAWLLPNEEERTRAIDWLAWSLQNEDDKPAWALMLYSREKGTGKSTFCDIARRLFGEENTATQNNVDKLTSRFNVAALTSRLVISEEVHLNPDSASSNALKTYITDRFILAERKGREPERIPLISSFILTTNHLPVWIEAGERRYYIVEASHDGHALGSKAKEFSELVGKVREALDDDQAVAQLYASLLRRRLNENFSAKTLNVREQATDVMKRLQAADRQVNVDQLEEKLNREARKVVTQTEVKDYITREFKVSGNSTRHLMLELEWMPYKVKWGGIDYARVIWAKKGYTIVDGNLIDPDGNVEAVCDYLSHPG